MTAFKNAVGFVRVSSYGQVDVDKVGIAAQKQDILLYAYTSGYNVAEWFIEEAGLT